MSGKVLGYIRVSSVDQKTDRQLEGETLDKVFEDRCSGKDTCRPALAALKDFAREGDLAVIHSMDRLARNLSDLKRIVKEFNDRGVIVKFVKEGLKFTGEDTAVAHLMMNVVGAVAEFERALIRERQAEGIALAKKKGVYKGRKPAITSDMLVEIKARIAAGEPKAQIARDLGISRETLYKHIRTT